MNEVSLKQIILRLTEWLNYLIKKWILIMSLVLLGAIIGFWYGYVNKAVYKATTTFVLEEGDKSSGLGQYMGLASMVGIDIGGDGGSIFQGDNILELYRSRNMIEKTLLSEVIFDGKKELLIERYISFNSLRDKWVDNAALKDFHFKPFLITDLQSPKLTRLRDSVISTVVFDINTKYLNVVKPDKKLSIIKVEVQANDEAFAKAFNEQIVKNVNDFYIQTKTKKSLNNIKILQHKTDSVKAILNGAIYDAAIASDVTPNLNPTRQVQRIAPVQRSQFAAETNKAVLSELVKNLELSKLSVLKETPLIQVIDTPVLPLERRKTGKIKGFVLGGFLFGFLTVLVLLTRKIIRGIMA